MDRKERESFFKKLGIETENMKAQTLQENLIGLKEKLKSSMESALIEIRKEIHEVAKQEYADIDKKNVVAGKLRLDEIDLDRKISKLEDERKEIWAKEREVQDEITEINKSIYAKPEVLELTNEIYEMKHKYEQYVKIFDSEMKRLIAARMREELISTFAVSNVKQIGTKGGKNE